jgi:phage baseplate assembly protein W
MPDLYYSPPLLLSNLLKKRELPRVDLYLSICHNLNMILITQYGENRFDPSYGCSIWDEDFENVYSNYLWQEKAQKDIAQTVSRHERRLSNIDVVAILSEESFPPTISNPAYRVKRRVDVKITGRMTLTNDLFTVSLPVYISPISTNE